MIDSETRRPAEFDPPEYEAELVSDADSPFVSVSVSVSGPIPEDVVATLRGLLGLLRNEES